MINHLKLNRQMSNSNNTAPSNDTSDQRERNITTGLFGLSNEIIRIIFNAKVCNYMKQTRPWMLANLKIIWQFHAHRVHQKVSRFFGPRYIGGRLFLGPNLVSFNRTATPYEISKVNFRVETRILVSMSEEI